MKKNHSILAIGVLSALLSTVPMNTFAADEVLEVTGNSNSTISNGYYQGSLADGSILGFSFSFHNSCCEFSGAISSASSISVPEKVRLNGNEYTVNSISTLDFDEATSVTSLTLPASISYISYDFPGTITDVHLLSETPPSLTCSIQSAVVWVPQSAYSAYLNNSAWNSVELHSEGWNPQSITVTVNTAGTFGNMLLNVVEQWTDVAELTVIGHMNEDDMKLLTRLKMMIKLDLSQTDISFITGCSGLSMLKNILLPSTVTEVYDNAFKGCSKLKEISIPNATAISTYAFSGCSNLESVSLPAATSMGDYAFYNCSNLQSVSLPAATTIGSYAFNYCSNLQSVSLPAATTIGSYAFNYCSNLQSVSLPAATSIGSSAFYYCSNLQSVSLPAATTIGSSAFNYCSNLQSVSLPAATSIGSSAFYYCSELTEIVLSDCIKTIGPGAFSNCKNLKDVYCYVIVPFETSGFNNIGSSATLHVPAFSVSSYMLCDGWYSFYKIVPIEGVIERLTINNTFTISDLTGLAEKTDLSVIADIDFYDDYGYSYINNHYEGHLNVTTNSKWTLSDFVQSQTNLKQSSSYDNNYSYYYSTMIPYNEISADNVTIKYWPYKNTWNFFTLPFDVNVSDIIAPEGSLWVIRKYSGDDRARMTGNTWQNMTNGMTLKAGEGYILHYNNDKNNSKDWFIFKAIDNSNKNNIFAYQDVIKQLSSYASDLPHNRNWNLVGNPYPCYYDTRSIEHNGVITVWNGSGYTAYSLLDDQYVLCPNEAFFVQCPADATSMKFKKEGRQHVRETTNNVSNVKAMIAGNFTSRYVYNLTLSGNDYIDKARVVINEKAKMDYEINCDASKFMSSNNAVPQLYVLENDQRFAIDERPLADGIVNLGAYFGETGEYTISLNDNTNNGRTITLKDNVTGETINLAKESYTFSAAKGTNDSRFSLTIDNDATGIDNMKVSDMGTQYNIYNVNGQRISAPQKGINIINGKKIIVP